MFRSAVVTAEYNRQKAEHEAQLAAENETPKTRSLDMFMGQQSLGFQICDPKFLIQIFWSEIFDPIFFDPNFLIQIFWSEFFDPNFLIRIFWSKIFNPNFLSKIFDPNFLIQNF